MVFVTYESYTNAGKLLLYVVGVPARKSPLATCIRVSTIDFGNAGIIETLRNERYDLTKSRVE